MSDHKPLENIMKKGRGSESNRFQGMMLWFQRYGAGIYTTNAKSRSNRKSYLKGPSLVNKGQHLLHKLSLDSMTIYYGQ